MLPELPLADVLPELVELPLDVEPPEPVEVTPDVVPPDGFVLPLEVEPPELDGCEPPQPDPAPRTTNPNAAGTMKERNVMGGSWLRLEASSPTTFAPVNLRVQAGARRGGERPCEVVSPSPGTAVAPWPRRHERRRSAGDRRRDRRLGRPGARDGAGLCGGALALALAARR
jgi:hypothetical protein